MVARSLSSAQLLMTRGERILCESASAKVSLQDLISTIIAD